jgi:CopG antitoxin of type II toxin-antitoxin system
MEKTIARKGLPKTDSIEELARFWDTHDLTDFEGDLEEAGEPVFVPSKSTPLRIDLPPRDAEQVKQIAQSKGLKETTLLRQWILERLHESSISGGRRPAKPTTTTRKTRRG